MSKHDYVRASKFDELGEWLRCTKCLRLERDPPRDWFGCPFEAVIVQGTSEKAQTITYQPVCDYVECAEPDYRWGEYRWLTLVACCFIAYVVGYVVGAS